MDVDVSLKWICKHRLKRAAVADNLKQKTEVAVWTRSCGSIAESCSGSKERKKTSMKRRRPMGSLTIGELDCDGRRAAGQTGRSTLGELPTWHGYTLIWLHGPMATAWHVVDISLYNWAFGLLLFRTTGVWLKDSNRLRGSRILDPQSYALGW